MFIQGQIAYSFIEQLDMISKCMAYFNIQSLSILDGMDRSWFSGFLAPAISEVARIVLLRSNDQRGNQMGAWDTSLHIFLTRATPIGDLMCCIGVLVDHMCAAILRLANDLHLLHSPDVLPQEDLEDVALEIQSHVLDTAIPEQLLCGLLEEIGTLARLGCED